MQNNSPLQVGDLHIISLEWETRKNLFETKENLGPPAEDTRARPVSTAGNAGITKTIMKMWSSLKIFQSVLKSLQEEAEIPQDDLASPRAYSIY